MTESRPDYIELDYSDTLSGYTQTCPLCFGDVAMRPMPGLGEEHWHCTRCSTEWSADALIEALKYQEL